MTSEHDQPLLRPLSLGALRLPNRVVMAPMTRGRATDPERVPTPLHAAHYGQRASAGLIVSEGVWVSERAVGFPDVPGLHSAAQTAAWRRVTGLVHALGGRIVAQLWHTGAASHPDHLGGALPAGPSAVNPRVLTRTPGGSKETVTPREMTRSEIAETVADYAAAAACARRAGFDGVEIAANGVHLPAQFLSPRLNLRTDRYGGADRTRLLLEVVDAAVAVWGGERRVGVRLSPYWSARDRPRAEPADGPYAFASDARSRAVHETLVAALARRPLAYLHLRGPAPGEGGGAPDETATLAFARYRRLFGGPLIANNGFGRDSGNAIVAAGAADAVSYARHFIANPDLVARFALGHGLATGDRATHYAGGARGYVDHPVWPGSRLPGSDAGA